MSNLKHLCNTKQYAFFLELIQFSVRALTVSRPTLITWKGTPNSIKRNLFSYNEEMGFSKDELKEMVLKYPDILKVDNELKVLNQFECLHNEAKIPHEILVKFPESLLKSPVSTR